MSKKKTRVPIPPPAIANISPELALKLLASLELLADHDTYETEYDGQMMTQCHSCGWLEKNEHHLGCDFIEAKRLIAEAYVLSDNAKFSSSATPELVSNDNQVDKKLEQWDIATHGLKVGGKLWAGDRGWFVIVMIKPGTVSVVKDT